MFVHHNRLYAKILLAADIAVGLAALFAAYWVRSKMVLAPGLVSRYFNPELLPIETYFVYFLVFLPLWVGLLLLTQRYPEILHLRLARQAIRVLQFVLGAGFLMGFLSYTFQLEISRPVFFGFLAASVFFLHLNRVVLHWVLRSRNINQHNQINILIVGGGERAMQLGQTLDSLKRWGFHVLGYLSTGEAPMSDLAAECKLLGSLSNLPQLLFEEIVVDEIIFVGSDITDLARFEEMIKLCEDLGIRTRLAADFFPTATARISMEFLGSLPLLTFATTPDHSLSRVAKRVLDFVVAAGALMALSPILLVLVLLIRSTSSGPVFYRQRRCGLYGRRFWLIKFRTMFEGAEDKLWEIRHLNEMSEPVFKMRNDPRVTPLGRFLRRFSIDEIPQFWNVIKGEMSIVGPRAPLAEEVQYYSIRQRRRLSVKPGITCLWQVSGRSDVDFQTWMDLDLQYIDDWSLWLDLRIMLKTIPAVFTGRGAR